MLLVTQLDLPCLRNVVRLMMSFEAIDGLKDKVQIVVNRVGLDNGHISLKKAKETIGRDIFWQLPNDYRVMVEMRNNGVPLIEQAPRASITQSIVVAGRRALRARERGRGRGPGRQGTLAQLLGQEQGQELTPAARVSSMVARLISLCTLRCDAALSTPSDCRTGRSQ